MRFYPFLIFLVVSINLCKSQNDTIFATYNIEEFTFQGREAKIVFPNIENTNGHWIWRARFWGVEPQVDKALLDKGFHLAYIDVAGLFGNVDAVNLWNEFYDFITKKYNFNQKVVLEGFSRGGLIIYNWASQNTEKVACIYADAPVCDIKSWPGGLYTGVGSPKDWQECLMAYKIDEKTVLSFEGIPLNNSVNIAKAKIPVIHVYGDSDKVVPHFENTERLAINFVKANGNIQLIRKKGIGHHPHSLEDPTPIVEFILKHTLTKNTSTEPVIRNTVLKNP